MARTRTEDLIRQIKQSRKSTGILVPKIEEFMRSPVEIEDDEDRQYLQDLIEARSQPRKKGVYSPSMLASCVRQVYFVKTGVKHTKANRIESSGYFLEGNFRHFKWQFVMWKMHRAGLIELVDVGSICLGAEVPVKNERGDFAGTLDNLIYIPDVDMVCTIDWKGLNGNGFTRAVAGGPSMQYVLQSVGYAGLANQSLTLPSKISEILIIVENKNGPVTNRVTKAPLGLVECRIKVADHQEKIAARVKKLRAYERKRETPPAECVTTRQMKFKDCPFAPLCRADVERAERKEMRKRRVTKKRKRKVQFNRKR